MILDRVIKFLLPRDDKFYSFFERMTQNLMSASELMLQLACAPPEQRGPIVERIHDIEHEGDSITHEIFSALNGTFITPFDREDIHLLASALDDILDYLDGSAARFILYKLKDCPPPMVRLTQILDQSIRDLHRGVSLIRNLNEAEELQRILRKVNEYENEADAVFEQAIANLFEYEKDPITVIKLKEIYVGLETATDKCEDAANVLEALLIKHS